MMKCLRYALAVTMLNVISYSSQAATWEDTKEVKVEDATKLLVFAGAGNLIVKPVSSSKITVSAKVNVPGDVSDAKEHFADDMQFYIKETTKKITLKAGYKKGVPSKRHRGSIDLVINMPKNLYLDLRDTSGNIKISGLQKGLKVLDGSGDLEIANVKGKTILNDGSGNIKISGGSGKLKLNDGSGNILISSRKGTIALNDGSGNLDVMNHDGSVRLVDKSGNISLRNIGGNVKIKDTSGNIELKDIDGNVTFTSKTGKVRLTNVKGNVTSKGHGKTKPELVKVSGEVKGI
ncbi:DUF4097 family beta strand repeat-containing protein [Parashewanella hymeniacidonis]|uniref:DUF4097 family beta strand repeat-containing protein n=1 Tax=Parashewanella hymeniacidonis TaxID=2807618 RepID=UPI001961CC67|nr:DUF4097 family beta strand repeat-containing protein [Parashewanella hymeniacidonis]